MKFNSFYLNRPIPVTCIPDTETEFVDQSEADRASLKFQLEHYGMDSLLQQFEKTKAQFGYADTRLCKNFVELQQKMAEANSYFMSLPSRIRAKFNHSATEFFSSIESDPEKAYKSGYISSDLAKQLGVNVVTENYVKDNVPLTKSDVVKSDVVKSDDVKPDVVESVSTEPVKVQIEPNVSA